ncbi:MFS general substrate transporter [Xylariaceae sp. FL1019]|nr:MFS general substrate transporter [Xylariaceae sp. FL1019]
MASSPSESGQERETKDQIHDDADNSNAVAQPKPERTVKGVKWAIVFVSLLSSTFLYALDNTVIANVRPSIVKTFDRIDFLPWLSVAYPLGEVGANPIWGKLNKLFQNKYLYLLALLIFEVGSAVIGSAQSVEVVVAGRALAGFGGSGIYVGTINIVSAITTPVERTHYLNLVGVAWCLGTILGPIIGGAFADSAATWRWAFYINIVIAAVSAPLSIWLIPPVTPVGSSATITKRLRSFDYVGAVLFLGGVASIIMVLGFGGALYSWTGSLLIALYVVTAVIWTTFALQQRFLLLTTDRVFPIQFVGNWEMVVLFVWTSIAISNLVVTVYSLPLFFQFAYETSPLASGSYTIPYIGAIIVSIGTSGPIFAKFPYYKAWFAGASALMLIGNGLLTTLGYHTPIGTIAGYSIISGLGVGPVVQLGYTVAQVKVAATSVQEVSQFLSCAQMAGLALSLGIATSVFLNLTTDAIASILPGLPRSQIMNAIDSANAALFDGIDADVLLQVRETIARHVGQVFYLNVAGVAVGLVLAGLMKWERLKLT